MDVLLATIPSCVQATAFLLKIAMGTKSVLRSFPVSDSAIMLIVPQWTMEAGIGPGTGMMNGQSGMRLNTLLTNGNGLAARINSSCMTLVKRMLSIEVIRAMICSL